MKGLKKDFLERKKQELFQELTSLGGFIFYLFLIGISFAFNNKLALNLIFGLMGSYAIIILIRAVYFRQRPNKQKYSGFIEKIDASTFPSMHAMRIAFICAMIYFYYRNILMLIFAFLVVLGTGYSRVFEKKHHWIDVIFGWIFGIVLAKLIF